MGRATADSAGEGRPVSAADVRRPVSAADEGRPVSTVPRLLFVHAHPDACVALSCQRRAIPAFHYMIASFGGSAGAA